MISGFAFHFQWFWTGRWRRLFHRIRLQPVTNSFTPESSDTRVSEQSIRWVNWRNERDWLYQHKPTCYIWEKWYPGRFTLDEWIGEMSEIGCITKQTASCPRAVTFGLVNNQLMIEWMKIAVSLKQHETTTPQRAVTPGSAIIRWMIEWIKIATSLNQQATTTSQRAVTPRLAIIRWKIEWMIAESL